MFKFKSSFPDKFRAALVGLQLAEDQFSQVHSLTSQVSHQVLATGEAFLMEPFHPLWSICPDAIDGSGAQRAASVDVSEFFDGLPAFLLRWHDNARHRYQVFSTAPCSMEMRDILWLLGYVVEYLLTTSVSTAQLRQHSYQYLKQQFNSPFPPVDRTAMQALMQAIWALPSAHNQWGDYQSLRPISVDGEGLEACFAKALNQFLILPESYPLAVKNAVQTQSVIATMMTGFMAGLWGGMGKIPAGWLSQCPDQGIQMSQLSDRLFASWAGISQAMFKEGFLSLSGQTITGLRL